MGKLSRRDFLQLAVAAATGAVMAACKPAAPPAVKVEKEAPAEKVEKPAKPAEAAGEISLWMFSLDPDIIKYMEENVVPDFQERYPNVAVKIEHVPYDGYRQKLTTATVGGTLPDLHECGTQAAGRVATSGEGLPIDDYVADWDDFDDYFKPGIEGASYKGYLWGVPFFTQPSVTLYWKDAFEEVGLDPEKPPTYDTEYLEYAKLLQKVEEDRIIRLGGWSPDYWKGFFQTFEVQIQRLGGEMTDEMYTEVRFNSPKGEAALAWIVELFQTVYPEGVARLPDEAPIPHFANKNIAMHMRAHGSNCRDVIKYNPDVWDDLGFGYPLEAKEGIGRKNSICWRNFLAVAPTSKNPAAAVEFAHTFTSTDHSVEYAKWGGYIPVRKSAMEHEWVKESRYVGKYLELGAPYGYTVINPAGYFELRQKGGDFFEAAALGKMPVKEALQKCAEAWEEGLKAEPPIKVP